MDGLRRPLGLFMGAVVAVGLWLVWLSVAGAVLAGPALRLREGLPQPFGLLAASLLLALVVVPPALFLARLGSLVAVRMATTPEVGRHAFVLALVLDAFIGVILVVLAVSAPGA